MSGFDSELKKLWTYIMDTSKMSETRISKIEEKAETIEFSVGLTNDKVEIERDNNRLRDEVVYLQSQSMRNNLTFSNIIKTNKDGTEDTLQVLRTFLEDKMKIAKDLIDRMSFERVHRMGVWYKVGTGRL